MILIGSLQDVLTKNEYIQGLHIQRDEYDLGTRVLFLNVWDAVLLAQLYRPCE
jgi:hypothetical protein